MSHVTMSQCHKLKTTVKYLIMNRLADGHDDAVSRCIDEFFGFAPYGKGESVYDQSHKWEPVRWADIANPTERRQPPANRHPLKVF